MPPHHADRGPAPYGVAALGLLVCLAVCVDRAVADDSHGLVSLQIKEPLLITTERLQTLNVKANHDTSIAQCADLGGTVASDANKALSVSFGSRALIYKNSKGYGFYVGANAIPVASNPNWCAELQDVPAAEGKLSSANCAYRWRFGFYDQYTWKGEPGTAFWEGLYKKSGTNQILNSFDQFEWDRTTGTNARNGYPRGYMAVVAAPNSADKILKHYDSPQNPRNNDPFPLNNIYMMCEVQVSRNVFSSFEKLEQPHFAPPPPGLTWAQKNWYVLYLIFAIIVLVALLVIMLYCFTTGMEPPYETPILPMVMREHVGFMEDDDFQSMSRHASKRSSRKL